MLIFLDEENQPFIKISDFGHACEADQCRKMVGFTYCCYRAQSLRGALKWMATSTLLNNESTNFTDFYASLITFFELICFGGGATDFKPFLKMSITDAAQWMIDNGEQASLKLNWRAAYDSLRLLIGTFTKDSWQERSNNAALIILEAFRGNLFFYPDKDEVELIENKAAEPFIDTLNIVNLREAYKKGLNQIKIIQTKMEKESQPDMNQFKSENKQEIVLVNSFNPTFSFFKKTEDLDNNKSIHSITEENFVDFLQSFKVSIKPGEVKQFWANLENELGMRIQPEHFKDFYDHDWNNLKSPANVVQALKQWSTASHLDKKNFSKGSS